MMKDENIDLIKNKVFNGMIILIGRDFGMKILAIAGQLILVRLIAPQYFGFFVILTFVVNLSELFSDIGLCQAIIREKRLTTKIISTIFYLKLLLSMFAYFLLLLSFPIIKLIYSQLNDEHFIMFVVFGIIIFIKSTKSILFALLDRELNFKVVSKIDVIGILIYYIVAIFFALQHLYIWNFIFAVILKEAAELILAFHYRPFIPKLEFSMKMVKKMIKYGSYLQFGSFVYLFGTSVIPIVGYQLNTYNLGLLKWSSNVASLSNSIFENYGRVAYAGISKIQTDMIKITSAINKSVSLLNIFAFIFVIVGIGFSKEGISLLLTERWLPATPALYWFLASTIFSGGIIASGHALLALGKSKQVVLLSMVNLILEIFVSFILLKLIGFVGIAIGVFFSSVTLILLYYSYCRHIGLQLTIKEQFISKVPIIMITILIVVVLNLLFASFTAQTLILKIMITMLVYLVLLYFFAKQDYLEIRDILKLLRKV